MLVASITRRASPKAVFHFFDEMETHGFSGGNPRQLWGDRADSGQASRVSERRRRVAWRTHRARCATVYCSENGMSDWVGLQELEQSAMLRAT
jgi:hypothetical protein